MPGTVTVACALPHGFVMQLQQPVLISTPTREDPSRKEQIMRFSGKSVRINGPAPNKDPANVMNGDGVPTSGGYALTFGVDKDFFEKWRSQMEDWEPLTAGQVFAHEREDTAKGQAKAGQAGPSGFEPYNPSKPPSEFSGKIKTAEK